MKVLITGTHSGIGRATALYFLNEGHTVYGFDTQPSTILYLDNYIHYIVDVRNPETFPDIKPNIIINNAGVQHTDNSFTDIEVNLIGTINVSERYAFNNDEIVSVLNMGSASAITGAEFPVYAASKGGITAYTKNLALRLAPKATANAIHPGGVKTELNNPVMNDETLWNKIMDLTPLKRWAEPEEIAEWCYFLTVTNKFMTGQNILIDGGEAGNINFVWPD